MQRTLHIDSVTFQIWYGLSLFFLFKQNDAAASRQRQFRLSEAFKLYSE